MRNGITRFLTDDSAATSAEYGLIVALIAVTALVGIGWLATSVEVLWGNNNSKIHEAMNK